MILQEQLSGITASYWNFFTEPNLTNLTKAGIGGRLYPAIDQLDQRVVLLTAA